MKNPPLEPTKSTTDGLPRFDSLEPQKQPTVLPGSQDAANTANAEESKTAVPLVTAKFFEESPLSSEEKEAESMISLMNEMRNMQLRNKNDPSLTDEQRRKNAEDMMLRLAAMMDIGDDSYDDEGTQE